MDSEEAIDWRQIAEQIDTTALQQGPLPTRAMIVCNDGEQAESGRVRFAAAFPMRRSACPQPVIVRDLSGQIVPSRLSKSLVQSSPALPPDRAIWEMELEFVVSDVPPFGWRAFGATFGYAEESHSEQEAIFEPEPLLSLSVMETECHPGVLPLSGSTV